MESRIISGCVIIINYYFFITTRVHIYTLALPSLATLLKMYYSFVTKCPVTENYNRWHCQFLQNGSPRERVDFLFTSSVFDRRLLHFAFLIFALIFFSRRYLKFCYFFFFSFENISYRRRPAGFSRRDLELYFCFNSRKDSLVLFLMTN